MASQESPRRRRLPPAASPTAGTTTISALDDDLLRDIFIRLPSLPSLVRAALTCRAFLAAVRASPEFRRRFRALHRPPLLGLFFDYDGSEMPSFTPVRARHPDQDLLAAVRGADVFLTRLPYHDNAWRIWECRGGHLLLVNRSAQQVAVYNPLTRALDLFPTPPDEISDGCRGRFVYAGFFLLCSDEAPGSFRVVSICRDQSSLRAAVFSSATREWRILPWTGDAPSGSEHWLLKGKQVNGSMYWPHSEEAYMVVFDAATLQFYSIDLPEDLKGQGHLYMTGETKDGEPCIVSAVEFTLFVWFRSADADGVEKWVLDSVIPLEGEVLRATDGSLYDHVMLKVVALLDGIVYLSTYETLVNYYEPCWLLSFCLETRKLEKIVRKRNDTHVHPYIMSWPPSLEDQDCGVPKVAVWAERRWVSAKQYNRSPGESQCAERIAHAFHDCDDADEAI
ncbi:hypothetical protein EJB05_01905, partial [Eragrostis curvula]